MDIRTEHGHVVVVGERIDPVGLVEPDHLTGKREIDEVRVIAEAIVWLDAGRHTGGGGYARVAAISADDHPRADFPGLPPFAVNNHTGKAAIVVQELARSQPRHEVDTGGFS